jgi:2-polyprenyl-6-methoxyphenol hydroxylase-like FAD-dependent oxidoreductase
MAATLFARAGLHVVVLEKHQDFLRDFRGDTVHPSTLDVLAELGLSDRVEALPHRDIDSVTATFADGTFRVADLTRLRGAYRRIMLVPQWDLLEMLVGYAATFPTFTLLRSHEAVDLVRSGDRVAGVLVTTPSGAAMKIPARLTVAADGRHSVIRKRLGIPVTDYGAPMDVLWFRVSRRPEDSVGLQARIGAGRLFVCIDRGEYWQIACVIPKDGAQRVVADGLSSFQASLAGIVPELADRVAEVNDFALVKELTVQVNLADRWHVPGALLIGDAAHAMSPIGGVGINLAVQDAVATARLLAAPLLAGHDPDLSLVRRRRWLPTAATQFGQRVFQRRVIGQVLGSAEPVSAPAVLHLIEQVPPLQGLIARVIGVGVRPEHI